MADLTDIQAAASTKIIGSDSTGLETNPVQSTSNGALHTNLRDNSGTEIGTASNRLYVSTSPNVISTANSTTAALGSNAVFTGTFVDILDYNLITVLVKSNTPSANLGVLIEWSADGTTAHSADDFTHAALNGDQWSFGVVARYFRITYTNGAIAQSSFVIQTILHVHAGKSSSHRVGEDIDSDDDAELVKATITGKANDGKFYNVAVDTEGRVVTSAVTGFGADFSFGDVTTASLSRAIVRRTAYTEQTSDAQRSIVSSSANDTAAGTGARTVSITYLDSTGAGPFTETITLNGTTAVNTVNTNICFIEQMEVLTAGSTLSNVGTISLKASTAGAGVTVGTMLPTNNQTFWAHHYVPIGKICNITGISCGHNGTTVGSGAIFSVSAMLIGVTDSIERQVSDFIRLFGQSSTFSRNYTSPIKVTGPCKLLAYVTPETTSSTVYKCAVDFFEP